MLEEYNFELDRLRGTRTVMTLIPTFLPDDKDAAAVQLMITAAEDTRDNIYLQRHAEGTAATAQAGGALKALHDATVSVYGAMRSRYRKDAVSMESIDKLPTQDQNPVETKQRATLLLRTWKLLPLPPDAPAPSGSPPFYYVPYDGMNVTAFEGLMATLVTKEAAAELADGHWEEAEGLLHEQQRVIHDFNVAAGMQGRSQFPDPLTTERELIDSIPTEPPVTAPGTASITEASSTGQGEVRLKASSARASRFDWEKLDENSVWTSFQSDIPLSIMVATGLNAGPATFRVKGKNSRGESEWSEPVEITVS